MNKTHRVKKYAKVFLFSISGLFGFALIIFAVYSLAYSNKVYARQYLGQMDLGGKTKEEVIEILDKKSKEILAQKFPLNYQLNGTSEKAYVISPEEIGLQFDNKATIDKIWGQGRSGNTLKSFLAQLNSAFSSTHYLADYSFNEEALAIKIKNIADDLDQPEKDFSIVYAGGKFTLLDERKEGKRIDQAQIITNLKSQIANLNISGVAFESELFKPKVNKEKALLALNKANKTLKPEELILKYGEEQFKADSDTIGGFIKSKANGNDLELALNDDRVKPFIESVGKSIDIESKNAKLSVVNGKAAIFEPSVKGRTLDKTQAKIDIENNLKARMDQKEDNDSLLTVNLKVDLKEPEISEQKINDLGIIELVGTATTSFTGSPANRVHNIQVGASAINGVLLKPDETFSTLKQLGAIDASSGYLEELVIKENKTVPEFGGGLCQVSSTLFRSAINAGLKIVERQNHKYRVGYYEPPVGMDATIYDPAPDFRFVNNFGKHILIQSKVVGTKITFDVYGTKDGRSATSSTPAVFDVVEPQPPLITETDTLPPGERKKIDSAHPGATASFHYKVVRGSDVLQEKDFVSKYVPWQEKWLVGKAVPAPTPDPAAPAPEATPAPATEPQPVPAT